MEILNTHPIKKSDLGFHGNLFGGKMLAWIDSAAAGYAMQLCDTPRMVTISIDKCFFERPAKEGSLIKIYGLPHKVGTTSITMYMECRAHNVYTGEQKVILRTNINAKLAHALRNRILKALKNINKSKSTISLLGCSIEEFKKYIESKFKTGMNWKNHGRYGWHIDHIKPCASFNLSKPEEQCKCFHYTNIQPLWWEENLRKMKK